MFRENDWASQTFNRTGLMFLRKHVFRLCLHFWKPKNSEKNTFKEVPRVFSTFFYIEKYTIHVPRKCSKIVKDYASRWRKSQAPASPSLILCASFHNPKHIDTWPRTPSAQWSPQILSSIKSSRAVHISQMRHDVLAPTCRDITGRWEWGLIDRKPWSHRARRMLG